jgi:hypothetical protein
VRNFKGLAAALYKVSSREGLWASSKPCKCKSMADTFCSAGATSTGIGAGAMAVVQWIGSGVRGRGRLGKGARKLCGLPSGRPRQSLQHPRRSCQSLWPVPADRRSSEQAAGRSQRPRTLTAWPCGRPVWTLPRRRPPTPPQSVHGLLVAASERWCRDEPGWGLPWAVTWLVGTHNSMVSC